MLCFDEIFELICNSQKDDWSAVESDTPVSIHVYKPNPKISLAFGSRKEKEKFGPNDEWIKNLTGKHDGPSTVEHANVLLNGSIVCRTVYLCVGEEGLAYLPIPENRQNMLVPARYKQFVDLLHKLGLPPTRQCDPYFEKAGIVVDESATWPG